MRQAERERQIDRERDRQRERETDSLQADWRLEIQQMFHELRAKEKVRQARRQTDT